LILPRLYLDYCIRYSERYMLYRQLFSSLYLLTLVVINFPQYIILVCPHYLLFIFPSLKMNLYLTHSANKGWLMRCVPFKVVVLRSWFLIQLRNQLLGVGSCTLIIGLDGNIDCHKARLVGKAYTNLWTRLY